VIQSSEVALTLSQYADLISLTNDPAYQVILEQYSLSPTAKGAGGAGVVYDNFDAEVCNDVVIRAWATTNTITVETLASEDSVDQSWSQQSLTAASIGPVPISIGVSGDTVRIFWNDGSTIYYFESTDKGSTWGSAQTVASLDGVRFLGAVNTTRLHVAYENSRANIVFAVIEYDAGWSTTHSDIRWPYTPQSFDAALGTSVDDASAAENDVVVMATDLPPIIAVGVEGTELTYNYERVQGIVVLRYQNGRWSDHESIDVLDNASTVPSRTHVRLTRYDDGLFMSYRRIDGTENYSHASTAVSRSKDGMSWEIPYLLGSLSAGPMPLLKRGDHVYLVDSSSTYRSGSTSYTLDPEIVSDVTDYVLNISISQGDIAEFQITLSNPSEVVEALTPISANSVLQCRIHLGYMINGESLTAQVILGDVDVISGSEAYAADNLVISGRDMMARLTSIQSDVPQEWASQQIGYDNFQGTNETKYSGLRHTAPLQGRWETEDNELVLAQSESVGVAYNTFVVDAWNGIAKSGIQVFSSAYQDYAGLVFRAYDIENMSMVWYDADSDAISLVQRTQGSDTVLDSISSLGWRPGTWYNLMVRYRYNKVYVYGSTDGVTWTLYLEYEIQGQASGATWGFGDQPVMTGRMGYIGFGYTPTPSTPPPPPVSFPEFPEDPIEDEEEPGWPTKVYVFTADLGVYYTENFGGPTDPQPDWSEVNSGLPALDVRIGLLDPFNKAGRQYLLLETDREIYRRAGGGAWTCILSDTDAEDLADTGADSGYLSWIAVDPQNDGQLYALFRFRDDVGLDHNYYVFKSTDYGDRWVNLGPIRASDYSFAYADGTLVVDGANLYVGFNAFIGGYGLFASSNDDGSSWTSSSSLGGSAWQPYVILNRLTPNSCYVQGNGTNGPDLCVFDVGGATFTILQDSLDLGDGNRPDNMWFDDDDASYQRVLLDSSIYITNDAWTSVEDSTPSTITPNMDTIYPEIWPGGTEDFIIFGKLTLGGETPHAIWVMEDETSIAPVGRAGTNCATSPYTDAIPNTCGGVAFCGIQVVE
jgi:hypothetical protein